MDQIHGSDPMDLDRKLARICSHILCVLGNYHMFLLATELSFGRHVCQESAPILRPWLNLANVSRKNNKKHEFHDLAELGPF